MPKNAKESRLVQRARQKLKDTLSIEHKKFTTEALDSMVHKIRSSILRHHPELETLRKRDFALFDENLDTAKIKNKQILKMEKLLKKLKRIQYRF